MRPDRSTCPAIVLDTLACVVELAAFLALNPAAPIVPANLSLNGDRNA